MNRSIEIIALTDIIWGELDESINRDRNCCWGGRWRRERWAIQLRVAREEGSDVFFRPEIEENLWKDRTNPKSNDESDGMQYFQRRCLSLHLRLIFVILLRERFLLPCLCWWRLYQEGESRRKERRRFLEIFVRKYWIDESREANDRCRSISQTKA